MITYAFAGPREAEKHLHEMWLREIEVVTFMNGRRTVPTDGYAPAPRPPEWAVRARGLDLSRASGGDSETS